MKILILLFPAPTTISIDLTTTFSGSTIYTVEAVDAADEDDNLIFNCTVDSSWVPLQCTNGKSVLTS